MSGMGELHLEIIKDRLYSDYKLTPSIGKMRVAYRETILNSINQVYITTSIRVIYI